MKSNLLAFAAALCLFAPSLTLADSRHFDGGRHFDGFRSHHRSRSSFSFSFGFNQVYYPRYRDVGYCRSYSPVYYADDYCAPPVVYRPVYDCPPPVVYVPARRVVYYDDSCYYARPTTYYRSEVRYYYGR